MLKKLLRSGNNLGFLIKKKGFTFNMCRNLYVIQNYKEIICIWIGMALQYKSFEMYENIIDKYILFKSKFEKFVQLTEMGSRFRNQCVMHNFPLEIRKKIYNAIAKDWCKGHLLECKAFAKEKILP